MRRTSISSACVRIVAGPASDASPISGSSTSWRPRGCRTVGCITAPVNTGSIAFHRAMGFELVDGDAIVDGVPIQRAYDGPGEDRVVFRRTIP